MLRTALRTNPLRSITQSIRLSSSSSSSSSSSTSSTNPDASLSQAKTEANFGTSQQNDTPKRKKTIAELDEELKQKMSGLAGDGGEAGVELEDGQPVSMKRSVRNNMFRYI